MAKKKKLFLHIGGQKCGSSAIQGYLFHNRNQLYSNGIAYIDRDFGANPAKAISHSAMLGELRELEASELDRKAELLARDDNVRAALFSTEGLCQMRYLNEHAKQLQILERHFDLEVIFYVRHQAEVLYSGWQQWGCHLDFDSWVDSAISENRAHWLTIGKIYLESLQSSSFNIRIFSRDKFIGGDIISDYCSLSAIPLFNHDRPANPTLPDVTILAVRHLARAHSLTERQCVLELKRQAIRGNLTQLPPKINLVCSPKQIEKIDAHYSNSNIEFFNLFNIPKDDAVCFSHPNIGKQATYRSVDVIQHAQELEGALTDSVLAF